MGIVSKVKSDGLLSEEEAREVFAAGLADAPVDGKRVVVITPDATRSGPMNLVFTALVEELGERATRLDFLIALGTHPPLSEEAKGRLFGLSPDERRGKYGKIGIRNHRWDKSETFRVVGKIPAARVAELTAGMYDEAVPVALNRLIFEYDHAVIFGPVFPHEVAGYSGGHKYLCPGIAGPDVINFTHWVGALATNFHTIGKADTAVREMIETVAAMVDVPRTGISAVVEGEDGLAGLFIGEVEEAWREASRLSAERHVEWVDRPYKRVVSVMPSMYDDIWVGAKGFYKMEPVVSDGGEIVIHAPHIKEISHTHGKVLDEIGYHVRDYFVKQWERFRRHPGGVLAHSTHLKGLGTFEGGIEAPRIGVSLATGVPKERCERLNLGYVDPAEFDPHALADDPDTLVVPRAGEILHRLVEQKED